MSWTSDHESKTGGEPWAKKVERSARRPRILMFDDSPYEMDGIPDPLAIYPRLIPGLEALGYEVIGVPVLNRQTGERVIRPDGTIDPAQTNEELSYFTYAVSNTDQLNALVAKLKPDAIVTDLSMPDSWVKNGHNLLVALRPPYDRLPRAIHSGGLEDRDKLIAQVRGYPLVWKRDPQLDVRLREQLSGPGTGNPGG